MRVLGRLRLSRSTEESTSIERQRQIIEQWAEANQHQITAWAIDSDVSGTVDPFDTPELGKFLGKRAPEWDVLAVWRLDRLTRSTINLNKLFGWCRDHDKTVVSVTESIDLDTPVGRLIANVIGFLAEGELEAIRERTRASKASLRETGRWGGGKPPYGYTAVKREDGPGKALAVDPLASTVVRRIVDDVLAGKSITRVARELNAERYLTPGDYYTTVQAGNPTLKATEGDVDLMKWAASPLRNILRSPAIRGFAHHKGMTVRDGNGDPVKLAEPLVTLDEWELIQAHLDRIRESRKGVRSDVSPLAGIVFCHECEAPLRHDRTTSRGHTYKYYRCENRDTATIPADELEALVEESFLDEVGDEQQRERVWVPGDSREADLRDALAGVDEVTSAMGRMTSNMVRQRLQRQLDALDVRIAELESAPAREARWEYRRTGVTYRQAWEESDPDERRRLLLRSGITFTAAIKGVTGKRSADNAGVRYFHIRVPTDLLENLRS